MKSKTKKPGALSPKQEKFCQEYVVDLNGTQALIRAGYSEKTAKEQASALLTKLNIKARIKHLQDRLAEKTGVTAERIIAELAKCGFSNVQDFLNDGNGIKDISKVPREHAAAVESIKNVSTEYQAKDGKKITKTVVTFSLTDKISALEKLGRHVGIFEKDNKQKESRITMVNDIKPRKSS